MVRWSSLHEQLGEPPRDLSYDMITAAVTHAVTETDSLDWKQALPGRNEHELEGFAKDVAAMANTRGGLVVYGVEEVRGTGAAKNILGVDVSEPVQRRLRALAAARIHPMVAGLDLHPLTADGQPSVLVLSVPASPDAPHIIGQQNQLGVPFRDGPETQWMRERDIERAYRDRFAHRGDETARLASLVDEVTDQLDLNRAWIVGVARPRTPLPAVITPPTHTEVTSVLESVLKRTLEVLPDDSVQRYTLVRDLDGAAHNPRVGLRRWIVRTANYNDPNPRSNLVHAELHHDGSVVFAAAMEGWYEPVLAEQHHVICPLVESFAADFVSLAEAWALHLGGQAPMSFRLDLYRENPSKPFAAVTPFSLSGLVLPKLEQVDWSSEVRRFIPVFGEIPVVGDLDGLRDVARMLAGDVLHQFAVPSLRLFRS